MSGKKFTDIYKHRPVDVRRRLGITDRQLGNCFDKLPGQSLIDTETPDPKKPRLVWRVGRQRLFSDANIEYITNNLLSGKFRKQPIA